MSPYHGCLAVGMGGHLPGHMRPVPCQIRTRLFSHPGQWAHRLAQGNLEAFVGGPVKGCLHEDGAIGQEPGEDAFLLLVHHGDFCGRVIGYALQEDLFGFAVKWKLSLDRTPTEYLRQTYWVVCDRRPTSCIEDAQTSYMGMSQPGRPLYPLDSPT